jgi:hypothetical protein
LILFKSHTQAGVLPILLFEALSSYRTAAPRFSVIKNKIRVYVRYLNQLRCVGANCYKSGEVVSLHCSLNLNINITITKAPLLKTLYFLLRKPIKKKINYKILLKQAPETPTKSNYTG